MTHMDHESRIDSEILVMRYAFEEIVRRIDVRHYLRITLVAVFMLRFKNTPVSHPLAYIVLVHNGWFGYGAVTIATTK